MFKVIAAAARITFASFALLCCAWLAPSQAQTTEPKLEYLMTYKALLEPAYKFVEGRMSKEEGYVMYDVFVVR